MNPDITKARQDYLNELLADDQRTETLVTPEGSHRVPNQDELLAVGVKLGFELIAHVRNQDDFDQWYSAICDIAISKELLGVLLKPVTFVVTATLKDLFYPHYTGNIDLQASARNVWKAPAETFVVTYTVPDTVPDE